jgi:ubiquinone/menaquinone biosynthesis C-methylase UbiE
MIDDSAKRQDYDSLSREYADPTSLQYKKLRLVDSYITGGKNLLDFGTGTGELIKLEEKKFDNIYGIDSDEESVRICRTRFENDERIHIVKNNANNITGTFAGIRFDCISACDVLEHLKFRDCLKLLDSFYSLLDTDGIFIFTGPGVFEKMKIKLGRSPTHVHSHSSYGWARLITKAGFGLISVESVQFPLIQSSILRKRLHVLGQCCVITASKGRS